jgi:hypothetical protein
LTGFAGAFLAGAAFLAAGVVVVIRTLCQMKVNKIVEKCS